MLESTVQESFERRLASRPQVPYHTMSGGQLEAEIRYIMNTSCSKEEITARIEQELGYPHPITILTYPLRIFGIPMALYDNQEMKNGHVASGLFTSIDGEQIEI